MHRGGGGIPRRAGGATALQWEGGGERKSADIKELPLGAYTERGFVFRVPLRGCAGVLRERKKRWGGGGVFAHPGVVVGTAALREGDLLLHDLDLVEEQGAVA